MRPGKIERKLKAVLTAVVLFILFPYLVVLFTNGTGQEAGEKRYLRVYTGREKDGKKETVFVESTEYMAGLLASDMEKDCGDEALKAHAVVIRTNLVRSLEEDPDKIFEKSDTDRREMERRWGIKEGDKIYGRYLSAILATEGKILTYNGIPAWLPYHQSSSGFTRSAEEVMKTAEYPYLKVRECPADKEAVNELQVAVFEYSEVTERCRSFLAAEADLTTAETGYTFEDFEILSKDSAGYVRTIRIGETVCSGDMVREALGLASSSFSINDSEGKLQVTTMGKGHGLGMSLWTAKEMAEQGSIWEEILSFFYEGTEVTDR